jgi:hypothetical protein
MATMPMMAKASGSKPSATAIGAKIGTVSSMIEIESMMQPRRNHTSTIRSSTPAGPSPLPTSISCAARVKPVMVRTRE